MANGIPMLIPKWIINAINELKSDLTDIATGVSISTNRGITKYGNRYFCNYRLSLATFTNGVATLDTITNGTEKTKTNGLRLQAVAYNSSGSNFYPAIITINNGNVTVNVSASTSGQLYVTSIGYFN